ncbi:MAG: hypothetical protein AAB434_00810 [Planctomycetota bacterium]
MKVDRSPDRVRIRYLAPLETRAVAIRAGVVVLFLVLIPAALLLLDVSFPYPSPVFLVLLLVGVSAALGVEPHRVEADRARGVVWEVPSRRGEVVVPAPSEVHLIAEERGLGSDERPIVWWQVRAGTEEAPLVAEKVGAEVEMGEVAAELARFYNVPLVRSLADGREVRIEPSDLDLSFVDRVRKYPRTLGPIPSPSDTVEMEDEGGAVTYRWDALTPATGVFLLALWVLSWFYLTWPVVPEAAGGRELRWEMALRTGDWVHFAVTVVPALLLSLLAVWWNGRLTLKGEEVRLEVRILFPVVRRTVALADLREVWASGLTLLLLTRTGQAGALFFDWGTSRAARFIAADLRYRLAGSAERAKA